MTGKPKFRNPPVVETVIGVQFPELSGFRAAHFGVYWARLEKSHKGRYKRFEDKPRLRGVEEPFPRNLQLLESTVPFLRGGVPDRVWYVSASEAELIQLQPDRFLFNWRRSKPEDSYPSYESNSKRFFDEFDEFREFCKEQKLDEPTPNLCEVTYINNMIPEGGESAVELFRKVFRGLRWESGDSCLPTPEGAIFNRVYVIGENLGRLYAEAAIAVQPESRQEFVRLNVTARVNHRSGEAKDLVGSLQTAHDWVVNGFASITDPDIQKDRWERIA